MEIKMAGKISLTTSTNHVFRMVCLRLKGLLSSFSLFTSVVVVVFQSVFRIKMHQNNIFLFFKNNF
jgi:hypothetical protein